MNIFWYVPGFDFGGVEVFTYLFVKNIDLDRNKLVIVSRSVNEESSLVKKIRNIGVNIISLNINHISFINKKEYEKKISMILGSDLFDVAHIHGVYEPFLINLLKKNDIPVILHAHEPSSEYGGRVSKAIKRIITISNIYNSKCLLTCSKKTGDVVFGRRKYVVLKNGIDIKKFAFDDAIRKKTREENNIQGLAVCQVGRLTAVKNQIYSLEVFKLIKKTHTEVMLYIIGDGEDKEGLEKKIIDDKLQNCVKLLGKRDDINEFLQGMDVYIMPSIFEGLGISLIEAQATGLKCIISDRVPSEAIYTNLVRKIPINRENVGLWAEIIMEQKEEKNREVYAKNMKNTEFDAEWVCKRILYIYSKVCQ